MVRALASHARGRRFEPYCLYHYGDCAYVAKQNEGAKTPSFCFVACARRLCRINRSGYRNNVARRYAALTAATWADEPYCLYHLCSTKKLQNIKSTRFSRSCAFLLPYLVVRALRGIFEFRSCILTYFSKNRT